ncbi:MAG: hydroxymethylbilane synthase, partial [Longimicrobiales bacterium]
MKLRLATRGSALALWQAAFVQRALEAVRPAIEVDIHTVRTTGDRQTDVALSALGTTGIFTSELDRRVAAGELDAAVHSLKDVPGVMPDGLALVAFPAREDPRDALVGRTAASLDALPMGARVGTSSLRRMVQLLGRRPDLEVVSV